jgi:hypothetical protein
MKALHRLVSLLRPAAVSDAPAPAGARPVPAPSVAGLPPASAALYDGLFCDHLEAFAPPAGTAVAPWQATLFAREPRAVAVRSLADDAGTEARVRALAWHWLREHGHTLPARRLLGVVFEVPMGSGLDVLAAYTDGSVRLLHHKRPPALIDDAHPALQPALRAVFLAARPIVHRLQPERSRRRPPSRRQVRLSFLTSDGRCTGEGTMDALQVDPLAGPLIAAGAQLLADVGQLVNRR